MADLEENISIWQKDPGNQEALSSVLTELRPTVDQILTSYAPGMQRQLETKAFSMTTDALKKYDPGKQVPVKNYLFQQLQPLRREFGKRTELLNLPENRILDRNRLNKERRAFADERDREPSLEELADRTGLSIKRVGMALSAKPVVPESKVETEKGDIPVSHRRDPLDIWADYVYYDLDPVDKKIFEWATGYQGTKILPKGEIARRLKISAAAVSMRITKITKQLQQVPIHG